MALGKNIKHHRDRLGLTLEQLSDRSGVDLGTIHALEARDSSRSKFATAIARGLGMTVEQLESGAQNPAAEEPVEPQRPDLFVVPIFDARASMGLGAPQPDHETVVDHMRLTKDWVRAHLPAISSPSNLSVLSAFGDSMSPTLSDGDIMLVDRGVNDLKIDAVYVLALNDELYVKRIQRRITDGAIIIKSDNALYDPVVVTNGEKAGLRVLGRVVWAWNGRKM